VLADPTRVGSAVNAPDVSVGPATKVAPVQSISATPISAPAISPIERVNASQVAFTPHAFAANASDAKIATEPQGEFRSGQSDLVSQLQDAAAGRTPSAAELTLQKANADAVAEQSALAGSVNGNGALAAIRAAGKNIAKQEQNNAAQGAIARANEQDQARARLAATLGQGREQDIGLASKQADLTQQSNITNSQLGTQVSISNADRDAARAMKDADLAQAAASGNAAAQNEMQRRQAELKLSADTTSSQLALDAAKSNQQTNLTTGLTDAQAANRMKELQAQINSQQGIADAQQANELTKLQAQINQQTAVTNAEQTNTAARADAANNLQVQLQNLDAKLKEQGMDDTQRRAYLQAWLDLETTGINSNTTAQTGAAATKSSNTSAAVGAIGTVGAGIAVAASDRRVKKDVVKVSDDAALRLADALGSPSEWTYTGEHDDGRRHVGWMAQDLEKDPLGKKFVVEGDDGVKAVDYQGLTAALLAAALRSRKGRR
jgi:hypothetical protein